MRHKKGVLKATKMAVTFYKHMLEVKTKIDRQKKFKWLKTQDTKCQIAGTKIKTKHVSLATCEQPLW